MEFNPGNHVVKLCIQGMNMEENGNPKDAAQLFFRAWNEAQDDLEKFIAAYHVARHQEQVSDKLAWLQTALRLALKINDNAVQAAFAPLHASIAKCYETLGDVDNAKKNQEIANSISDKPADAGPFYHGTRARLQVGDFLKAGYTSNYDPELTMNHIYFTALLNGAGLAAALSKGDGRERVYVVEPTGDFENDPNVTNKKFPGNLTRSYRTRLPLKVIGEIADWQRQTAEEVQKWQEKLANNKGKIIN